MPGFRIFYLDDRSDRVTGSHEFTAGDDLDALARAEEFRTGGPMELWSGNRKIRHWEALDPSVMKAPPGPRRPAR